MLVTQDLLPDGWLIAGSVALAIVLLLVAFRAPWGRLAENETQHCFLGGCVALVALWSLSAGLHPGLSFHFCGVTALTLMIGCRLATLASLPVMVGLALTGSAGWDAIGINGLVMAVLVATRPGCVISFDDQLYLYKR